MHADSICRNGAERRADEWAVSGIDWDVRDERMGKVDDRVWHSSAGRSTDFHLWTYRLTVEHTSTDLADETGKLHSHITNSNTVWVLPGYLGLFEIN